MCLYALSNILHSFFIRSIKLVFDIFKIIAIPIIKRTATKNIIAKSTLKVSDICSITPTIFLSAIGSHIADENLYNIVNTVSFIIGNMQIPIIIIIPTIPIPFFITDVAPKNCIYRIP